MLASVSIGFVAGWLLWWVSDRLAPEAIQPTPSTQRSMLAATTLRGMSWPRLGHSAGQERVWPPLGIALLSAVVFAFLWERLGPSWEMLRLAASYGFFVVISLIDLRSHRVPNSLVYPAAALTLVYLGFVSPQALVGAGLGGGIAFFIFSLTAWLRPGDLGGGDIKLATLIGIGFGFPVMLWALLIGAAAGAGTAIGLLLLRRWESKRRIPYAPFLCLGAWVALVYHSLPLMMH